MGSTTGADGRVETRARGKRCGSMRVLPVRRGCPGLPGTGTGVENILDDTVSSKRFQETRRADVHNAARPRNARFVALGNIMFPRLCALLLSLAAISAPAYSALDVDISVAAKTAMQMGSGHECCLFSEGAVASDGKVFLCGRRGFRVSTQPGMLTRLYDPKRRTRDHGPMCKGRRRLGSLR